MDNEVEEGGRKRAGIVLQSVPKRMKKVLAKTASDETNPSKDVELIYSIEGNQIIGSEKPEEEEALVIPVSGVDSKCQVETERTTILMKSEMNLSLCNDEERFLADMKRLPPEVHVKSDVYDRVPVEEFGAALLRGMGWRGPPGTAKNTSDYKATVRPYRLGLGAGPTEKGSVKGTSSHESAPSHKEEGVMGRRARITVGDFVACSELQNRRGQVVQTQGVPGLSKIRVKFEIIGQTLDVSRDSLTVLASSEVSRNPLFFPEASAPFTSASSDQRVVEEKESSLTLSVTTQLVLPGNIKTKPFTLTNWIFPGLRVQLCSVKSLAKGNERGTIIDVHGNGEASVQSDKGKLVDVRERDLRPVLPVSGEACQIVVGPFKGKFAVLLQQTDSNLFQAQLTESYRIVEVRKDEICATRSFAKNDI